MATDEQRDQFRRVVGEVKIMDSPHPNDIHCRLCESLPYRVAFAALPLMLDGELADVIVEAKKLRQSR